MSDRIAIAANDRIEIVNPCNDLLHEQILKSHTRYISDIDWNPKEPYILGNIFLNFKYCLVMSTSEMKIGIMQKINEAFIKVA